MSAFPEHFAILRSLSSRGPAWQLLESRSMSSGLPPSESFYRIDSFRRYSSGTTVDNVVYTNVPGWTTRRTVSLRTEDGELLHQTYWKLPMTLQIGIFRFPVLEFEYKAWLPRPSVRIPIPTDQQDLQRYYSYQRQVILQREDRLERRLFDDLPRRPPSPPILSRPISPISTDSDSVHSIMTVYPSHPLDYPVLPPSPVQQIPSTRPLPIPELVGSLLIQNARTNDDTCPISTVPYKELVSLTATSCFHIFDTESIQIWLKEHQQCPVCRHSISNLVTKEIKNWI